MRAPPTAQELEALGAKPEDANALATRATAILRHHPNRANPRDEERTWTEFQELLLSPPWRWFFEVHRRLYATAYDGRRPQDGPGPAWFPNPTDSAESNLGRLMAERGMRTYEELHRWSATHREEFWATMIRKLGIVFRREPDRILDPKSDATRPEWFPGARLNIAESCFRATPEKTAIIYATEASSEVRRTTYAELSRLSARVAHGLEAIGVRRGERIALYMPMTPESVAIYLGTILAGRVVVGIADASSAPELAKRLSIADAKLVFTVGSYVRDGKELRIYDKVIEANGPRAVVAPSEGKDAPRILRPQDLAWSDFLGSRGTYEAASCRPSDPTNILFSSGTTKDPKAIPWTHAAPIRAAVDANLHLDTRETDVLAWPTSFGWMMGPWLTYASLVSRATMALYVGETRRRPFGTFVEEAGVTMLGVVPKLVRGWKQERSMEGLDWGRVRRFASTAETSTPDEMLYLMFLAGYRPVIEYCGGTEIGGAYISGTMLQPSAPSTFTTPTVGLEFLILEDGLAVDRGEVFLVPPSIGLSNDLLNYDHRKEYFDGVPRGPHGEVLRRHGDQLERLGGGLYRHHGRIDDMINIGGVKTSAEEVRSVIANDLVYDSKPVAIDVDDSGQRALVIYAVPKDSALLDSLELRERLRTEFHEAIRERLNPLVAHVHDVILVAELPQAGPGKTRTMLDLQQDYRARAAATKARA